MLAISRPAYLAAYFQHTPGGLLSQGSCFSRSVCSSSERGDSSHANSAPHHRHGRKAKGARLSYGRARDVYLCHGARDVPDQRLGHSFQHQLQHSHG